MITKFEHVGIRVSNMDRSIQFYTEVLGCTLVERMFNSDTVELAFLTVGDANCEIELIADPEKQGHAEGKVDHFAFSVDDPDKELERLRSAGVPLIHEEVVTMRNRCRMAFFYGPDGERLEIFWRPAGSRDSKQS